MFALFSYSHLDKKEEETNEIIVEDYKTEVIAEYYCQDIFHENSDAKCILYDDENCDGYDGIKKLKNGDVVKNIEEKFGFDVESISIKKGCQLTVYSGK